MGDFREFPSWKWSLEPKDDFVADFLLPALSRARRYDRLAGFFSSSCLLVSAKGIEHLIKVAPRSAWPAYRLVVCEQLSEDDVEAIQQGLEARELEARLSDRLVRALETPADAAALDRLGLLAAMVAVGFAEIRVAVPKGPDGRPKAGAVEHAKVAIVHDTIGNTLVGFGSANESWHGWVHNNEQVDLYASWDESSWMRWGKPKVDRFERLWQNQDDHTIVVDLPRAVREKLISFAPVELPPELQPPAPLTDGPLLTPEQEQVLFQFIKDAPRLSKGGRLGMATAAVQPWPHHVGIVDAATEGAPRFLFCDEVGLGKTAEAAFTIRQLVLDGRAKRVLILVPKSVLNQWQDELREKFNLHVPIYTGSELISPLRDHRGAKPHVPTSVADALYSDRCIVLASSQLMRRENRRAELLDGPDWDLVVIDEAHHARRRGFSKPNEPPNNLLSLAIGLGAKARGMLLLTATPMQIDPQELWDLLRLLGLPQPFHDSYDRFRTYYQRLAHLDRPDFDLAPLFEAIPNSTLADADMLSGLRRRDAILMAKLEAARSSLAVRKSLRSLSPEQRRFMRLFFLAHAPTRRVVFRTTRDTLRKYRDEGRLRANIPEREVQRVAIPLTPAEEAVYKAVEDYLHKHYVNAANSNQQGLGFVLTSYRKRLASSMYAVSQSLRRRLDGIRRGTVKIRELLDEDEDFYDAIDLDDEEERVLDETLVNATEAVAEIEDLLGRIQDLGGKDSKYQRLIQTLDELSKEHPRVIVFTQYKDTMDYLRSRLVPDVTPRVACYSSRGGEIFEESSGKFIEVSKDDIKASLEKEGGTRLLVCTDAAAEGLNLQVCGALVNYDMPWNPMRAEQRIGRIDRIGQSYSVVRVRNFFYTGTVEDDVYKALNDRINLFQRFVGPLQPILATVQRVFQKVAMTPRDQQEEVKRQQLGLVESDIVQLQSAAPELPIGDDFVRYVQPYSGELEAPVRLEDLRTVCLRSPLLLSGHYVRDVGGGVYELRWGESVRRITFSRDVMEREPESCQLFSYGDPAFDNIIGTVECPPEVLYSFGLRRVVEGQGHRVRYLVDRGGMTREVATLSELLDLLGA